MQILNGDRRAGKTTYLLTYMKEMLEAHGIAVICICADEQQSMDLLRLSRHLGYSFSSWQFMSFEEAKRNTSVFHGRHRDRTSVVIDNADMIFDNYIASAIPIYPSMVTWSAGDNSPHKILTI